MYLPCWHEHVLGSPNDLRSGVTASSTTHQGRVVLQLRRVLFVREYDSLHFEENVRVVFDILGAYHRYDVIDATSHKRFWAPYSLHTRITGKFVHRDIFYQYIQVVTSVSLTQGSTPRTQGVVSCTQAHNGSLIHHVPSIAPHALLPLFADSYGYL